MVRLQVEMDITAKAAKAFRKVRKFFPAGTRFFLLERGGQTERFSVVRDVTDEAWFVNYNSYREQMQFELAINDSNIDDQAAQTSYLGYGVPDTDQEIDVYPIKDGALDKTPPTGSSPTWKLFGIREPKERFTVPA
jgi:hypothetical protein